MTHELLKQKIEELIQECERHEFNAVASILSALRDTMADHTEIDLVMHIVPFAINKMNGVISRNN